MGNQTGNFCCNGCDILSSSRGGQQKEIVCHDMIPVSPMKKTLLVTGET